MEDLFFGLIEKYGEKGLLDLYVEKTSKLNSSLMRHKTLDKDKDYLEYVTSYNNICKEIADVQIFTEAIEFLFNNFEINKHYDNLREMYDSTYFR